MAFITAETRSSIVELAMGMLNQAPSSKLLTTLIGKSTEGASLQDLADYIATTDAFTAEYPATQTAREFATEMFGKLITGGTLDADINTAVIDLLEGLLIAGTTKAEGFVAVINFLADSANADHPDLGDIAQAFQNRADAAEYFSITKELGGSTDAELAAAIASVTSDAATLTAANTAADATESAGVVVAGQTFTLTAGADSYGPTVATATARTTTGNDTFRGQLDTADFIDGGEGTDTINASIADGIAAVTMKPLLSNVEAVNLSITDGDLADNLVTLDLGDSTGVTDVALTLAADVTTSLKGVRAQNVTLKAGGATSVSTVAYSGLSSATNGGQDAKTINLAAIDLVTLTVAGVEELTLNASGSAGDIDAIAVAALETLTITGGITGGSTKTFAVGTNAAAADSAIEFDGLDTGETGLINASNSTGSITLEVDDSFSFTALGGAGKLTISNDSAGAAAAAATAAVTVTAGAGGIAATIEGGANASTATAMTLVAITGADDAKDTVDISGVVNPTDITSTTAINESKTTNATVTTGSGDDTITIGAGVVSIDAGAGNDTLIVGSFSEVTSTDSIDLGDGVDIVTTSEATLSSGQAATMARFLNAEVVATLATAEKVINMTLLGTVSAAVLAGTHAATAASGVVDTVGIDALDFTSSNTNGTLRTGALTGQAGAVGTTTGAAGGLGLDVNATLDNGSNAVNITFVDDADITGGAGGAAGGAGPAAGGAGGTGIDANEYETINIVLAATDTTKDTVTISGGAGGAAAGAGATGATGADIIVGSNATINITETLAATSGTTPLTVKSHISSIDLGTISGNNVNVQASTINGGVTIAAVSGNTTIVTGAGADTISTGSGTDTISTGAGNDVVNGQAGADTIDIGTGGDIVVIESTESTEAATVAITGYSTAAASWTGSAATDSAAEIISTGVAGGEGDVIDFDTHEVGGGLTITVEADSTGTANLVAGIAGISTGTVTANVSNGRLTVAGTSSAAVDTLAEWVDVAQQIAATEDEALIFEFSGDTYIYSDNGAATDYLVKLVGVTGATGLAVAANSGTVGGEGFVIIG